MLKSRLTTRISSRGGNSRRSEFRDRSRQTWKSLGSACQTPGSVIVPSGAQLPDVVSSFARRQIKSCLGHYVVRVDVPADVQAPHTRSVIVAAQDQAHCAVRVALILAENPPPPGANIQVRVWSRGDDGALQFVLDRTVQDASVRTVMREFAQSPRPHTPIPPLAESALDHHRALGGPFDTDHALIVASATPQASRW